ncbi:hypothetical protein L7F22_057087 [Adiantum nelumboides]|nr:hypothetical protein [Adiantum nelumboides]
MCNFSRMFMVLVIAEGVDGNAFVCSFCFCFIGSLELQIGRRLLSTVNEGNRLSSEAKRDFIEPTNSCCRNSKAAQCFEKDMGHDRGLSSGVAEALINGSLHLPFTDLFTLSPVISCIGGCEDEFYCSDVCAKAAWDSYHSLLCSGLASLCKHKEHLMTFVDHANETNDIFLVAAKVVSSTILKALQLKQSNYPRLPQTFHSCEDGTQELLEAWEPFSMGFKRLWWNSVALPPDLGPNDEMDFRNQLKELASQVRSQPIEFFASD